MPKRTDFAKLRRTQARALTQAVRDLSASIEATANQHGIDLHGVDLQSIRNQKSEKQRLLAERLQESVVPLFIAERFGQPERIGSCVLVRLDSKFYAFTAAHVIRDIGSAILLAPSEGRGGKLLPLRGCTAHLRLHDDLDVGVIVLPACQLGPFEKHIFLDSEEIDREDRPDEHSFRSFYFVLGYSASRTQVKVSRTARHIHQQSFHCETGPVDAAEYLQERVSQADHMLLDFDHKEIRCDGKRANPPRLQGVSGGGIFHISRESNRGPLVAIATQNRRSSRLIVGTRVKHFLAMVRESSFR